MSIAELTHKAHVPADDGSEITFSWHFTRGMLQPRMSALELATFLLHHMPSILPMFANQPRVYSEFAAMLNLFVASPKVALDEVLPWVQSVTRTGPDDIVVMSLFAKEVPRRKTKVFY